MKKLNNTGVFKLGWRITLISAVILFPLLLLAFFLVASLVTALIISLVMTALSGMVIYAVSQKVVYSRIRELDQVFTHISNKKFRDITNLPRQKRDELDYLLKRSEAISTKIDREYKRLKRMENYRKEFIGDISHELKTPTFAIQGFLETLLEGAIDDPNVNRQFLEKAMKNAGRLDSLTRDLMEISKLETGEHKLVKEPVHLNEMIHEVIESLQYQAEQEGIELSFKEEYSDVTVQAERQQLRQVLINLIDNGIKYNKPQGKVTVGLNRSDATYGKILVYVSDTGIGIAPRDRRRITERFYRVDKSRSREKGGTGLGLSIVKHVLEAHSEELYIDSKPEAGTTFTFTMQVTHSRRGTSSTKNHQQ